MPLNKKLLGVLSLGIIVGVVILSLVFYSYSQIEFSLNDVSAVEIKLESLQLSDLIQLSLDTLSGNWIKLALTIIAEINIGMVFELTNNGFFPVYVPDLTYDLFINGIFIGQGNSEIDTIINPGQSKTIEVFQNLEKNSFSQATDSIIETQGIVNVHVNGTAFFELFGQRIPVPFESTKNISIIDELQKQISSEIPN